MIKIGLFYRTIEIANRLIILISLQINPILITKFHIGYVIELKNSQVVNSNNQNYQSILILILLQKNSIENRINFSLGNANNETYERSPIVKQIIRCRYPSDIRDYARYKQPTVSFTLDIFIDLFAPS